MKNQPWIIGLVTLVCGTFATCSLAQEATAKALPQAHELTAKHIEAMGGRAVLEKVKSSVSEGKFELAGLGVEADVSLKQSSPDKFLFEMKLPGLGDVVRGTDGTLAWELNAFTGSRLMEGMERNQFMRQAELSPELQIEQRYEVEVVGTADVDGTSCIRTKFTPKEGTAEEKELLTETRFFDDATFLLKKLTLKAVTPLGNLEVDTQLNDYRKVDGVMVPHQITQSVAGQTQVMKFQSVRFNVALDDETFRAPDEIAKLAADKKD